nr:hypothetical protein [Tanacetum cinerariifolium]
MVEGSRDENAKVNEGDDKDNNGNVNTTAAINYEFTSMMETLVGFGATDYPIGRDESVINPDTTGATDTVAVTFSVDNVASIFGVCVASLKEVDIFTRRLEAGDYADTLDRLDNVERQAAMDAIFALCNKFMASWKQCHEFDPITDGTIPCVVSHVDKTSIIQSVSVQDKPSSYVGVAGVSVSEPSKPKANFRSLFSDNVCNGVNFSIPRKVVETVITRYDNTLYGYFIGKRIVFSVVEYYARNKWGKFGLTRIMMNSKGIFLIKFKTTKGFEDVLENGPWMIRSSPIILK